MLLFSHSVMSNFLWPHGLQHTSLPCTSPTSRLDSNLCPLSWWCHPTISSCHPLLLLPSVFLSIRVFSNDSALHMRWPKYWSFSFSVLTTNNLLSIHHYTVAPFTHFTLPYPFPFDNSWSVLCFYVFVLAWLILLFWLFIFLFYFVLSS